MRNIGQRGGSWIVDTTMSKIVIVHGVALGTGRSIDKHHIAIVGGNGGKTGRKVTNVVDHDVEGFGGRTSKGRWISGRECDHITAISRVGHVRIH